MTQETREKILFEYEKYESDFEVKDTSNLKHLLESSRFDDLQLGKYVRTKLIPTVNDFTKVQMTIEKKGEDLIGPESNEFLKFVKNVIDDIEEDEENKRKLLAKCKKPLKRNPKDMFSKLAGMETEKQQLKLLFIYPIEYPSLFKNHTAKGILFYGPPGTGKTYLARISVAELKRFAYFAPSSGDLEGKYVGETQKKITGVFECASEFVNQNKSTIKQSIIFFDEFDSIAKKRSENPGAERSVNTILQMMDGIKSNSNVAVMAATNLLSEIDEAVLSRFPIKIFVDLPDNVTREFIVREELSNIFYFPNDKHKEDINAVNMPDEKFYELGTKFGIISLTDKGRFRSTILDRNIIDEKDAVIDEIVKKLGPIDSTEVKDIIQGQGRRSKASEFSYLAVSKWGYSARDIRSFMSLVVGVANSRVIQKESKFLEYKHEGEKYYIYVPYSEVGEIEIPDVFLKKATIKTMEQVQKDKIISFDIRESDFTEVFKRKKSSIDDYKQYTMVPED